MTKIFIAKNVQDINIESIQHGQLLAWDDGNKVFNPVTIAPSGIGLFLSDEGTPLGGATEINFIGSDITDEGGGLFSISIPSGTTDHGELSGLGDDDHTQYLTNERGDARYLYRENTDPFVPDGEHEPATKGYVDSLYVPAIPFVNVSASKGLTLSDANTVQRVTEGVTITVPAESDEDFEVGTAILIYAKTDEGVIILPDDGVTINSELGLEMGSEFAVAVLIKEGEDEWLLYGSLSDDG